MNSDNISQNKKFKNYDFVLRGLFSRLLLFILFSQLQMLTCGG